MYGTNLAARWVPKSSSTKTATVQLTNSEVIYFMTKSLRSWWFIMLHPEFIHVTKKHTSPMAGAPPWPTLPHQSFIPEKTGSSCTSSAPRPLPSLYTKNDLRRPARGDQQPMTGGSRRMVFRGLRDIKRSMILLAGPNISSLLIFIGTRHLHLEWLSPGSRSFVTMLPLAVLPLEQVESSVPTFFLIPESLVLLCIHCLYV